MKKLLLAFALPAILLMVACTKDTKVNLMDYTLKVSLPSPYENESAHGLDVTLINKTSGSQTKGTTNYEGIAILSVEVGVYDIKVRGEKTFGDQRVLFQQTTLNQSITKGQAIAEYPLEISSLGSDWLIKEIYFTGGRTAAGKATWKDQYVEIYNNSDRTLYADGIAFSCSANNTSISSPYYTDLLPGKIAADFIYVIPGGGTDHPVESGKSVVIAGQGIDHTNDTGGGSPVDLSKADFEMYDDHKLDIDVPEVPNMDKWYSASASITILHTRGYQSFFIFRPDKPMEAFLSENKVMLIHPNGQTYTEYTIPTALVYDGVESGKKELQYKSFPSSVDVGSIYTDLGAGSAKVAQRKVKEQTADGRFILLDTNNSDDDFLMDQLPSPFVVKDNR